MELTLRQESNLLAKLRQPLHVNYVSWLLKCSESDAKKVIDVLVSEGKIEEYNPKVGKDYYVSKNQTT